MNERDKAFYNYKKDLSVDNYNIFKTLRNKVQILVHNAKKDYFNNVLDQNKNYSSSLWKTLKNLGLPSKKGSATSGSNICLNIDNNICFEKKLIAATFNKFYTTIACKFVAK